MRRNLPTRQMYHLKRRTVTKTNEGSPVETWGEPVDIDATIWSASGQIQASMYGEHLSYIKNMEYEGPEVIKEHDGICVYVSPDEEPDYIVKSVNTDYSPKLFTLERRVAYGTR